MKASDYVAAFLVAQGVKTVYEMTGGMITHLLDSLYHRDDIDIVSIHHEQAAAFAAEAGARMTGIPGVAMATSGPGATNLITGIGSCYFDSVPAVFITGQVNTHEQRGVSGVRQAGFQETDIVAVASPLTKAAWQVERAADLPEALARAFRVAQEGRPGPVLIDLPMDVQRQEIHGELATTVQPSPKQGCPRIDTVLDALACAERPLILVGGGVRSAGSSAVSDVRAFAESVSIPVVSSLMGIDVLSTDHPLRVGLIGSYGNRWANLALGESDCVLVLGARLDVRQTGSDVAAFARGKTLIQVDVDPNQLNWRVPTDIAIAADISEFAARALREVTTRSWPDWSAWLESIAACRKKWPDAAEFGSAVGINPAEVMHALSRCGQRVAAFVTDVGQNQMWAAQSLRLAEGQRFLTSGGMGAMGFALPAAVGAAFAAPTSPIVAISGDGGMQVNIQELETVARLSLPIKMVVLNNGCLGMVRQFQDELFGGRHQSTVWGYGTPDFVAVSHAYGIPARNVSAPQEVGEAVEWLMADPGVPQLLEVTLSTDSCVRPKVSFGNPVYVMDMPEGRGSNGE